MDIKLIVALIGLVGVLSSALVQYYLGRQSEQNKKAVEVRSQAYLDLINSVSEIAGASKHAVERSVNQLQKLTQAKSRVALIGSDEVVSAVNQFWKNHGSLDSDEAFRSFSLIVAAMRKDLSGKNTLPDNVLKEVLFG